jgi:hypothetical protein
LARQTRFFFLVCEQDLGAKSGGYFSRVTKVLLTSSIFLMISHPPKVAVAIGCAIFTIRGFDLSR